MDTKYFLHHNPIDTGLAVSTQWQFQQAWQFQQVQKKIFMKINFKINLKKIKNKKVFKNKKNKIVLFLNDFKRQRISLRN